MAGSRRRLIEGYRYVCTPGSKPCEICAQYCGQEFVHDPREGQRPIAERPDPPMHPHCRCKLELIENALSIYSREGAWHNMSADLHGTGPSIASDVNFSTSGLSEQFNTGGYGPFDLVYCTDGRKMSDGPTYGNFGGQRWRFGRNEDKIAELAQQEGLSVDEWLAENYKPPIDSLDSLYEDHDYCYGKSGEQQFYSVSKIDCDKELIQQLQGLDEDPQKWPHPPRSGEDLEYAKKFRADSLNYFEAKADYAMLRSKYGTEYVSSKYKLLKFFMENN